MVEARSTLEKLCDAEAEANADAAGTTGDEYEAEADTGEAYGSAKRKAPPLDEDEGSSRGRYNTRARGQRTQAAFIQPTPGAAQTNMQSGVAQTAHYCGPTPGDGHTNSVVLSNMSCGPTPGAGHTNGVVLSSRGESCQYANFLDGPNVLFEH